jgi:transcriptional antiterminator RfaH
MKRWYVVHTQPRDEDRALWHLENQGFECFLPRMKRLRSHARTTRMVLEPLFPRYLFAFFDSATTRWRSIGGSRGVTNLVTNGVRPVPVPEGVVEKLLSEADEQGITSMAALALLWKGRKVRISDGVFTGHVAEVDAIPPGSVRVNLLLTLLGRVTTLQVPSYAVEPL